MPHSVLCFFCACRQINSMELDNLWLLRGLLWCFWPLCSPSSRRVRVALEEKVKQCHGAEGKLGANRILIAIHE